MNRLPGRGSAIGMCGYFLAVGVATDEPLCVQVDPVKRRRLAEVGADWIVPNYNCYDELMAALFPT